MRSKHQQHDDDNSRLVDQVTAQVTDATQQAKLKSRTLQDNEAKINRLQSEVGPIPSVQSDYKAHSKQCHGVTFMHSI